MQHIDIYIDQYSFNMLQLSTRRGCLRAAGVRLGLQLFVSLKVGWRTNLAQFGMLRSLVNHMSRRGSSPDSESLATLEELRST